MVLNNDNQSTSQTNIMGNPLGGTSGSSGINWPSGAGAKPPMKPGMNASSSKPPPGDRPPLYVPGMRQGSEQRSR